MRTILGWVTIFLFLIVVGAVMTREALAQTASNDVECAPWATAEGWSITRCESWGNGEVCLIASSGMVFCRFD